MHLNREELLFQLALMKPAEERAAFLERKCGDDKALRARIEALLAAHEQTEGVLADSAPAAAATMNIEFTNVPDETVGQKIGRYKILEKVGEGGCGVVYVAEQTEPAHCLGWDLTEIILVPFRWMVYGKPSVEKQ